MRTVNFSRRFFPSKVPVRVRSLFFPCHLVPLQERRDPVPKGESTWSGWGVGRTCACPGSVPWLSGAMCCLSQGHCRVPANITQPCPASSTRHGESHTRAAVLGKRKNVSRTCSERWPHKGTMLLSFSSA